MKCVYFVYLATLLFVHETYCQEGKEGRVLSRRKRYLAFPEGSTFVIIWCATIATIMPFEIFYEGINWGVAYPLPNVSTVQMYKNQKHAERRRQRRDLYNRFEAILDSFPLQSLTDDEPTEHGLYQMAYRRGRQNSRQECSDMFPGCPVSLIDVALGYYHAGFTGS
ncbi:hypothetical protein NQ315_002957 [Exocentrus adspersus]|uniref:Uncharacterized protein n=1 Tax=Exocentrus adspersus TaxID=1586481 RepID=A0AAV8W4V0_9CUCU|nr:hypothetical protein NQ315_002957 [Exocentrus adspersus]